MPGMPASLTRARGCAQVGLQGGGFSMSGGGRFERWGAWGAGRACATRLAHLQALQQHWHARALVVVMIADHVSADLVVVQQLARVPAHARGVGGWGGHCCAVARARGARTPTAQWNGAEWGGRAAPRHATACEARTPRTHLVSSAHTRAHECSTRSARSVMSPRLPRGVGTMYRPGRGSAWGAQRGVRSAPCASCGCKELHG